MLLHILNIYAACVLQNPNLLSGRKPLILCLYSHSQIARGLSLGSEFNLYVKCTVQKFKHIEKVKTFGQSSKGNTPLEVCS